MPASELDIINKKFNRIEKHLGEETALQLEKLLKKLVSTTLINWYNDYDPKSYQRTENLMNTLSRTYASGKGNIISFVVDSGNMSKYPSWSGRKFVAPSLVFNDAIILGDHGYGYWFRKQTAPSPFSIIEADIVNGFNGQLNEIVNNKILEILNK